MDDRPTDTRERAQQDLDIEPTDAQPPARIEAPRAPQVVREFAPQGVVLQQPERSIMRHSAEIDQLFAAIAEARAQPGWGDIEKSKTARIESRREGGRSYSYEYETLADVIAATEPFLSKTGVVTTQLPFVGERSTTIRTMMVHKSGQWFSNDLIAVIPMPDPQGVGSAISYLRRYALKAVHNVSAHDDDDDATASQRQPEKRQEAPRPAQRMSEQARAQAASSAPPADPKPANANPTNPANVGVVATLTPKGHGVLVTLDTGYRASTADPELKKAVEGYHKTGARIELRTRASSDPAKYAPVLEEIVLQHR